MRNVLVYLLLFSFIVNAQTKLVHTQGTKLFLNDNPYLIKGICYHPVPKGEEKRSFETLEQDIALMVEAGINTIRVYEPIDDIAVLNQLNAAGIQLIVGFGYNQNGVFDIASETTPNGLGETSQLGTRHSTVPQQPSRHSTRITQ